MAITFNPPQSIPEPPPKPPRKPRAKRESMSREIFKMPFEMVKELDAICERRLSNKSMLVREAVRRFIEAEKAAVAAAEKEAA